MPKLILASKSPRRRELLDRMGLAHMVVSAECDEWFPEGLSPAETVKYISREKAFAAANMAAPEDIVITADTMVFLDDKKLGKPADEAEARQMLRSLSGRGHDVYTAVHLILVGEDGSTRESSTCELTHVTFFDLAEDEIESYVATGEPLDKAGAYGIQGIGRALVRDIDGDYFNVVGLPVARTLRAIDDLMGK